MSRHKKHRRHIDHSKENNNKKSTFDINTIADLLNNIKPEDLSALLSTFNLGSSKNVNQNELIQEDETMSKPDQDEVQNTASSNTTMDLLTAIKPLVSYERGEILDKIIQIYSISNIIKK